MIDIAGAQNGQDLAMYNTQAPKAANTLSVQLGALEYAPELGIDLRYFLEGDFEIQDESFNAYLIQTLAANGINVNTITQTVEALWKDININLSPENTSTGFIAR